MPPLCCSNPTCLSEPIEFLHNSFLSRCKECGTLCRICKTKKSKPFPHPAHPVTFTSNPKRNCYALPVRFSMLHKFADIPANVGRTLSEWHGRK